MRKLLKFDLVRFGLVGVSGFVLNVIILTILYRGLGWPIFISQLVSAEISLFSNFLLHHNWTYKYKGVTKSIPRLFVEFHISSWAAILGGAFIVAGGVQKLHIGVIGALILTSFFSLAWNFSWTKFVIWRAKHHEPKFVEEDET